jgi:ABC-type transporter Mla subunit MlaD
MSRTRTGASVFANPVLVGAVTVLVVNVAVFLSYNANQGLPFVPTKQLKVELENGANLLPGNEIREGGYRIGVVQDMKARPLPNGKVGAIATLKIDQKSSDIPVDSRVSIRPRSVLGLKYVELTRGRSKELFEDGDTMRVDQTRFPVELDELYGIFDEETREGSRRNLQGFGDAFAMRGASLNRTIAEAPRFLRHLEPVMSTLAERETRLGRFFSELNDFTRTVRPVAGRYAHSFTAGADTFEAWSRDPEALKATITKSAPTMDTSIRSFRVQRPFLAEFRDFSIELDNAAQELPRTLPRIVPALETGIPVLKRSPSINEGLRKVLVSLRELMEAPGTGTALRGLTATVSTLNPTVRFVGPYITVCNYWNYSWTHVAEHLSEPDPTGGSQRTLLNQAGRQDNSVTSLGAAEPANGENVRSGTPQFLHSNNYSAAVDEQGNADCESGQRGYVERQNHYGDKRFKTVVDPHIPGNQGTTYTGRERVPEGQTFTRQPDAPEVPKIPPELDP